MMSLDGVVDLVLGQVVARTPDGEERVIDDGDEIHADETLVVEEGALARICSLADSVYWPGESAARETGRTQLAASDRCYLYVTDDLAWLMGDGDDPNVVFVNG